MAHIYYDAMRLIIVIMTLITVMMGFVRYGAAFFKQLIWIGIVVGIIMFGLIPNL